MAKAKPLEFSTDREVFPAIIGSAPAIVAAKRQAQRLAGLQVPVLLLGPTGTGKDVFARAMHRHGRNASGPFVPVNCGAVLREMLASELFGYVEGAFTGARRGGAVGKFEAADGGTLFLDEIGDLPLELQPLLLRALEDGEIYRLGENRPRKPRVRVISATHRDLLADVKAGRFRADLFYRLSVAILRLPGLSERREDLPELACHFIRKAAESQQAKPKYPTSDLLKALAMHSWPGNIRELRNVVESMMLFADGDDLTVDDLPPEMRSTMVGVAAKLSPVASAQPGGRLASSERIAIVSAIQTERGNLTRAALRLGIAKSTLYEKMKRHGIDRRRARLVAVN